VLFPMVALTLGPRPGHRRGTATRLGRRRARPLRPRRRH
jgi:hypothetical protein